MLAALDLNVNLNQDGVHCGLVTSDPYRIAL